MSIDLTGVTHHPAIEEIVDVLCNKTQNNDRGFFRVEVAYFLAKMASCMGATIVTKDRGDLPVNIYAMALATSGFGKGHSVNIVENEFMKGFFKNIGIDLIDFKIEFGRFHGQILLADEISPDTCRFWDSKTHEKLDKDRFRRDMGGVEEAYQEISKRLGL